MFIYKITNTFNNKFYIGLTKQSVLCRLSSHFSEARNIEDKSYLNRAIRKYGKKAFKIETIDTANNYEELKQLEVFYIALYDARNRKIGYNLSEGGDGTPGVLKSAETRDKIRQKALGRKWSEERKKNFCKTLKNSNRSYKEAKENLKIYNESTSKKIGKYDTNKNLIKIYSSISETHKTEKIDRIGLIRYLKSDRFENNNPYKGFLYKTIEK